MRRSFQVSRLHGLLGTNDGLTTIEAEQRRKQYGANGILTSNGRAWSHIFRDTARDPMVWFLVGTASLFAFLGDITEATVLAVALLPIVAMDAYLHRRTQASTAGLRSRLATQVQVSRDGQITSIDAVDLVPGDLVLVSAGQTFPADGLVISGENLQADESVLTGESLPVRKRMFEGIEGRALEATIENSYWGIAGTRLLTGAASLRVVFTGADTRYGQIIRLSNIGKAERTPLQLAIGALVSVLLVIALTLCVALAVIRYSQGYGLLDATLSAVTLAVAALPEEFPVVFTFFLGVGVFRLAGKQALVRRAVVVENIGRVTCICTDKTGTLTEGQLRLAHIIPADNITEKFVVQAGATASRSESGDPLDQLLLQSSEPIKGSRLATFPFTEDRRKEVAIVRDSPETCMAVVKGAPETVFAMLQLGDGERADWLRKTGELAITGHKVIACAVQHANNWTDGEPDKNYQMAGLLAFEDPVREGVADAVASAQAADINVIMVTGDHAATARAIAIELGIGGANPVVVNGDELAGHLMPDEEGAVGIDVVARALPSQKLALVQALQQDGEIVAVTGDGVNDVPALQGADIGIAMGERGTQTAREVAAIVLMDDNFGTIVRAISEGRQLFYNLKLSFAYLLIIHLPLVVTAALIPSLGFPLLYLPVHIVWLELIIHPTALLVFQQPPKSNKLDIVSRPTKPSFYDKKELSVILSVGTMIIGFILMGFYYAQATGDLAYARSIGIAVLVTSSASITAGLSGLQSREAAVVILATIASAVLIIQLPELSMLMHLSQLGLRDWAYAAISGLSAGGVALLFRSMQTSRR